MDGSSWHALSGKEVAHAFGVVPSKGLSTGQVAQSRTVYGANVLHTRTRYRTLRIIVRLLVSPLSLVLLVVGVISAAIGEWVDMAVVLVVLVVNVVVGAFQEGRARKVFQTLAITQKRHAIVIRDGTRSVIPADQVVVGDILLIEGGVAVVADARLLRASELSVNEASLTGEWVPVSKAVKPLPMNTPLAEQENMLWSGTSVTGGYGSAVVTAVGRHTALGLLAAHLSDDGAESRLQKSVRHLARVLMIGVGVVVALITIVGIAEGQPLEAILLVGVALAVAVMPEGLPAAVTVVLAVGMEVILRKGGLVKSLIAAETLGSTTYIITDKTGTLTEGKMSLSALYTVRALAQNNSAVTFPDNHALLSYAVLASDAFVTEEKEGLVVHGRPIEKALMSSALEAGISQQDLFMHGGARIAYLQFESARRFGASLNEHDGGPRRMYFTGSPEVLLAKASHVMIAGGSRPLDAETRAQLTHVQERESAKGHRFVGVAYAPHDHSDIIAEEVRSGAALPHGTVFAGLISFADTIRTDVAEEIAHAHEAGIRVLMATGDYPETARAVAAEVGIATPDAEVVTGAMIEKMDDAQLLAALRQHFLFARVVPEQKLRMVRVLRSTNEIVAMTGDGVNDAPALVSADIGVAVGSGTDVAKEAADLVLLKNSFGTITAAIAEGRRIGDNLRKIVGYLLSTSFSELFIMLGALVAGAPIPLLPTQILWSNVIQEGVMSFPFAFEPPEAGVMKRAPEKPTEQMVLIPALRKLIIFAACTTGVLILGIYAYLSYIGTPLAEVRTVLFVSLTLDSILYMFSFKDLHRPLWRTPLWSNPYVVGALCINITLLAVSLTVPPLMALLSLTPLSMTDITLLVVLGIANVLTIELAKAVFFEHEKPQAA